jgi:diacylglycerol kinase (ATP)
VIDRRRCLVIVNPAARRGALGRALVRLRPTLERLGEVVLTAAPGDASRLAATAASEGREAVFSVGGDGTHGAVVHGLVGEAGPPPMFGLIPFGTGSDFARQLPLCALEDIVTHLARAEPAPLDVGFVHSPRGRHAFLNIASVGMGGRVDALAERFKALGRGAYAAAVLGALATYTPCPMRVVVDGVALGTERLINVIVANGRFGGGGMRFAPDARPDDGLFDVILVPVAPLFATARGALRLYRGRFTDVPEVRHLRGRVIEVTPTGGDAELDIDGEPAGPSPARFELVPHALQWLTWGALT